MADPTTSRSTQPFHIENACLDSVLSSAATLVSETWAGLRSSASGGKPTPTQKPFTTDSAEARLIYDTTKQGEGIYAELVKQYPFDQGYLSLKVSDTCKYYMLTANTRSWRKS